MKEKLLEALYQGVCTGIIDTPEYNEAVEKLCGGEENAEFDEKWLLLVGSIEAECKLAFRAGFQTAITILNGGVDW